jgi:hypothetical protein
MNKKRKNTAQRFHDLLFDETNCIPIEEAIKEAERRWPKKKK